MSRICRQNGQMGGLLGHYGPSSRKGPACPCLAQSIYENETLTHTVSLEPYLRGEKGTEENTLSQIPTLSPPMTPGKKGSSGGIAAHDNNTPTSLAGTTGLRGERNKAITSKFVQEWPITWQKLGVVGLALAPSSVSPLTCSTGDEYARGATRA